MRKGETFKEAAARRAEIVRLRTEERLWPEQIAERLGMSIFSICTALRRAGLSMTKEELNAPEHRAYRSRQRLARNADRNQEIVRLRQEGLYPIQIAELVGVSSGAVAVVLRKHGLGLTKQEMLTPEYLAYKSQRLLAAARARGTKLNKILELLDRGYSVSLVAQALKSRRSNIHAHISRARQSGIEVVLPKKRRRG